jgi:chromate transporter
MMSDLLQLFLVFFKIGAFTFGGGYAMLSIITDNCVERKGWITHDEMMDITVIAETTPGPVAINCATFVGHKRAGFWGAVCATLGVVLPSFLVIYAISMFLEGFLEITLIANAFKGIKIAVGFLILQAGLKLQKQLEG